MSWEAQDDGSFILRQHAHDPVGDTDIRASFVLASLGVLAFVTWLVLASLQDPGVSPSTEAAAGVTPAIPPPAQPPALANEAPGPTGVEAAMGDGPIPAEAFADVSDVYWPKARTAEATAEMARDVCGRTGTSEFPANFDVVNEWNSMVVTLYDIAANYGYALTEADTKCYREASAVDTSIDGESATQ